MEMDKGGLVSAIEQASEAIVMTDPSGKIQYVNPGFSSMTRYAAEEIIGRNPSILKSGKQHPRYYEDLWKTIGQGRPWHPGTAS